MPPIQTPPIVLNAMLVPSTYHPQIIFLSVPSSSYRSFNSPFPEFSRKILYTTGGQRVDHGRSLVCIKIYFSPQSINSSSFDRIFGGSNYFCEERFSQVKKIKSRYRIHLTDEHSKHCLQFYLSNYGPSLRKSSQDMQCQGINFGIE